jgi:DNA-binding XRE family transcriptional regulator/predicted RNase H-like HicB family nuclease
MQYYAYIRREGRHVLADFPDCPGCQTFGTADDIATVAQEALEGWLEAHLVGGQVPPKPQEHVAAPEGAKLAAIPVRAGLAVSLNLRWARAELGLTQSELGRRVGVSQQQIAKLEDPDENPSIVTIEKVAAGLGLAFNVSLVERPSVQVPSRRRS